MLVVSGQLLVVRGEENFNIFKSKKLGEKFGYCEYSQYLCGVKLNDSL
nr:MAG TPA: hypothetical protein [Caudoviricetes sp.]